MAYTPRRPRRSLPSRSATSLNKSLANVVLLVVALTVILLARCDSNPSHKSESGSWVDYLITPKHLRLPKSVIDVQQERDRMIQNDTAPLGTQQQDSQDRTQRTPGAPD